MPWTKQLFLILSFTVLIAGIYSVESVHAADTYKVWILAYNVDPQASYVSACAFGPSVDTPNCAYFDFSKIFTEKGGKKDFIAGFVSIVSNTPPPSDMQVCLEAQQEAGTNAKPGDWLFQCKPVTQDNKGFYVAKFDLKGMKRIPSSSSADSQPTTSKPNNMGTNQNGLGSQSVPESPSASIAETNEVSIAAGSSNPGQGQGFVPPSIAIETDTTVTWTNNDDALHTVTSGKPEGGNSGTEFDSSYLASGKKFQHDFISTGQYSYYCTLHPFMTGTIYVTATIGSN